MSKEEILVLLRGLANTWDDDDDDGTIDFAYSAIETIDLILKTEGE